MNEPTVYLPQEHTDFVFTIVPECPGFLFAAFAIALAVAIVLWLRRGRQQTR